MADSQADARTLAERYATMMNEHNSDGVDSFVAVDYINLDVFQQIGVIPAFELGN